MKPNSGLTKAELAVVGVVTLLVVLLLCRVIFRPLGPHTEHRRVLACTSRLHELGKGLLRYTMQHDGWCPFPLGRGTRRDGYNGAEWLATLYWTRFVDDADAFLCPGSGDTNHAGSDLCPDRASPDRFGPQTVSYAGIHYWSLRDTDGAAQPGALHVDAIENTVYAPAACDDTQGSVNHGKEPSRGFTVLFFDGRVWFLKERSTSRPEWLTSKAELDLEREVGLKDGPFWQLRN